jgi:hypothetical protein
MLCSCSVHTEPVLLSFIPHGPPGLAGRRCVGDNEVYRSIGWAPGPPTQGLRPQVRTAQGGRGCSCSCLHPSDPSPNKFLRCAVVCKTDSLSLSGNGPSKSVFGHCTCGGSSRCSGPPGPCLCGHCHPQVVHSRGLRLRTRSGPGVMHTTVGQSSNVNP